MARFNVSRCNRAATAAARHWHVVLQALIAIVTFALMCEELVARSRAQLWQAGGERGWNSDPSMRIYFYANHEEPPAIPLIWSQRLTDSNLAVAGLSLALTLQRGVLAFLGFDWALFNIASDIFLALFWSHSAAAQMSSDLTDLEHVSLRPWYLERGCSAVGPSERSPCVLGQACFVMAVVSLMFHATRVAVCILFHVYNSGRQRVLAQIHEKEIVRHTEEVAQHRRTKSYSRISFDWHGVLSEAGSDDTAATAVDVELGLGYAARGGEP